MADLARARALLLELQEALADETAAPSSVLGPSIPDPDEHVLKAPLGAKVNLAVIVGHHANAKGAYSPWIGSEWDFNRVQAERIRKAAFGTGCRVEVFQRNPQTGSIYEVADRVNRWAASDAVKDQRTLAISLHFNSFRTPQANGTETLFWAQSQPSEKWATELQRCMLNCFGLNNRGLLPIRSGQNGSTILRETNMTCALIEPAFGSNPTDAAALEEHWPVFADELVTAALAFGA